MSRVPRPRGRLPRRVYWTRRLLVLGLVPALAVALVVGLAHLLGAGSRGAPDTAATVRVVTTGQPTPSTTVSASPSPTPWSTQQPARSRRAHGLPPSEGTCAADDVLITPVLPAPHAYGDVKVVLELTTQKSPACSFDVDAQSVFLTIRSGEQIIWSSQDCPAAIPTRTVVARRDHAARVRVTWDGKQSDPSCSRYGSWATEGQYVASAVARGSVTPIDVGFRMLPGIPVHPTIFTSPTGTPTPSPSTPRRPGPSASPSDTSSATPTPTGTATPRGHAGR